jgi:hypothetical protein
MLMQEDHEFKASLGARRVAQVAEYLPRTCEALRSNLSTTTKKNK